MTFRLSVIASLFCLLTPYLSSANETVSNSFQGFSGYINTPSAELFNSGDFYLQYSNQVETRAGYKDGLNYNFGIGLWENVEVSGRLADYDFGGQDGLTDLSANVKISIPYIPQHWFKLAVGVQDVGGAANFFDAKYVVASKQLFKQINFSLGLGQSESNQGRLDGVFSAVSWQPYDWAKLSLEYDASEANVGMHLSSPKSWFTNGLQLSANVLAYSSSEQLRDEFYYGVGFSIPLDTKQAINITTHVDDTLEARYNVEKIVDRSGTLERMRLKNQLIKNGFESIKVGEAGVKTVYVELENHSYNRNQIDGLAVALSIISNNLEQHYRNFKLVLKEREIPILVVSGSVAEYLAFLNNEEPLNIDISTNTYHARKGAYFANDRNTHSSWLKPRFTFWPSLVSRIGTEYGVFDSSLALVSHVELPLWQGGALTALHTTQLAETDDFKEGKKFSDFKQETGLQNYSLHQTFALPYNLKNMTSLGRYRNSYNYVANELRWQNTDGRHRFGVSAARYENQSPAKREHYSGCNILFLACWKPVEPLERDVFSASYKYYLTELDTSAEVLVGQFWQQDKGARIKIERMFGDISINLTYYNTKEADKETNQFVGIGFSMPLTPRKDYNHKYFQVRGKPKWSYSVNTLVGKSHNNLTPGTADSAVRFYNLNDTYYNYDRLGKAYIYANAYRLKQLN